MSEKALVRRCRAGEPGARKEMYETYAGHLLAVCRRYVRDTDRARDLVHDTFLKAWDSIGTFRPRRAGSLSAWLTRIATHLAVDDLRSRKLLVAEDASFADSDRRISPEEAPVDTEWLRQVPVEELIDLVASLPEGYRTVFNLFCLDGNSHKEIAKTSQTQYLKARRKLAAMLAAKYGSDEKD